MLPSEYLVKFHLVNIIALYEQEIHEHQKLDVSQPNSLIPQNHGIVGENLLRETRSLCPRQVQCLSLLSKECLVGDNRNNEPHEAFFLYQDRRLRGHLLCSNWNKKLAVRCTVHRYTGSESEVRSVTY